MADELAGRVLNDTYRLDEQIGQGAMGEVYRATHLRLGSNCAVKILPSALTRNAEALERFLREAQVASRIGHPHIVQVLDTNSTEDGLHYYAMELLAGEDLETRLDRPPSVPLEQALRIIDQTASALSAAHEHGVVHRDLKPSNVFLTAATSGQVFVKVFDFGVSKVIGLQRDLTGDLAQLGTPSYMAPEQAAGRAGRVDHRADIYALATVTFHLLTGDVPFAAEDLLGLLYKVVHEEPPSLAQLRPDLPAGVGEVIGRALDKRPEARPASAVELARQLREAAGVAAAEPSQDRLPVLTPAATRPAASPSAGTLLLGVKPAVDPHAQTATSDRRAAREAPTAPSSATPARQAAEGASVDRHAATATVTGGQLEPRPRLDPRRLGVLLAAIAALVCVGVVIGVYAASGGGSAHTDDPARPAGVGSLPAPTAPGPTSAQGSAPDAHVGAARDSSRPARAARRALRVTSRPRGARVLIDGALAGRTPLRDGKAPTTAFRLTIKHRGYHSWSKKVAAGDRRLSFEPELERRSRGHKRGGSGVLKVVTLRGGESFWAHVFVDGNKVGQSPIVLRHLPVGRHRVTVRRKGFSSRSRWVTVKRHGRATALIELQ